MCSSDLSEYESKVKTALETNPDEEYGFYVIEDAQRNMEPGAVVCDMATNNWLVVPEWSEKTDAVMYFLDWMFGQRRACILKSLVVPPAIGHPAAVLVVEKRDGIALWHRLDGQIGQV